MCLRFVFLLIMRLAAWLRLSRRAETWKTAEILILRHQLTVLQRRQPRRPKLNRADRALLAALLSVIPKARRHGLRLLVTPDTILRWHHDIVRRRQAARSNRVGGMGCDFLCPAGADAVEPAGEQGLAETVADELFGLGDAHVDRPFLDHYAGQPGRVRRAAHRLGGAEDGHSVCLEVDVPVRNLPARILSERVDPVTCLASAGITENGCEHRTCGAGCADQLSKAS